MLAERRAPECASPGDAETGGRRRATGACSPCAARCSRPTTSAWWRVRRPGRRRARPHPAAGRAAEADRLAQADTHAYGAARRRRPRPAHPARGREGLGVEPAQPRRATSSTRTARELLADRRRVAGPAGRAGRQPARHEPAAGRRDGDATCSPRRSTRWSPARSTTSGATARTCGRRPRRPARRSLADPGLLERVLVNLRRQRPALLPGRPAAARSSAQPARRASVECASSTAAGHPAGPSATQIFLPFQRLGDTDNTTGIGLGLALSRGLAEAMGGTLEPEETPGGGLTMVLALPAATGPTPLEPGRRERDSGSDGCAVTRVLVVDDEPQILRALRINLRARGLRRAHRRRRAPSARGGRQPPTRARRARPRAARPRRHRGDRRPARLDRRADPGALRALGLLRQGRGPRRRRRRLRHQAVRDGRAARPDAGDGAPRRPATGTSRRRRARRRRGRPRRPPGDPRREPTYA